MMKSDLLNIPGIGKTFIKDFARIDIYQIDDLKTKNPERLFKKLQTKNTELGHTTSKNYLYVIRMAVYYANGGRDEVKLRWSSWKNS